MPYALMISAAKWGLVHACRIEGRVSIYFQCTDEGQIYLPKVQAQDVQYNWIGEELAVVSVAARSCKACAFYEDRKFPLRKDNMLGSLFQVCEVDFADTGKAAKSQQGQFDASFSCQDCKAPPPATPAPTAPVAPPNPSDARKHQGLSYGQSVALIVTSTMLSCVMMAALAVLGYKWHKARRKAQAEVAFDAALQDSGLGLDDAFEQDTEAFHQSLLHPSAWYQLKDGPSDTGS
ncbi:hypothetical protein ABBQ38_010225 [Trebouxia sp. C0009 RCD-2024]